MSIRQLDRSARAADIESPHARPVRTFFAILAIAVLSLVVESSVSGQQRMQPAVPGTPGDPVWQGTLRMPDGRAFVTDGGLVIDAAIGGAASLPEREIPPKVLEDYFSAPYTDEYGFREFTATGTTYATPNGIPVNATYIDFLRRVLPASARFRFGGAMSPIVVIADGMPVAAFMPVRQ